MENNFNNRDFEQFVKQNADQYRMFPSEKVWNGIHNTLHTRRRWYGIGLGLLLLTTGVVAWVMFNGAGKNREVVSSIPTTTLQQKPIASITKSKRESVIMPAKAPRKGSFITPPGSLQQNIYLADPATISLTETEIETIIPELTEQIVYNNPPAANADKPIQTTPVIKGSPSPARQIVTGKSIKSPAISSKVNTYSFLVNAPVATTTIVDSKEDRDPVAADEKVASTREIYPLTIESVINSYTRIQKRKKVSLQVYFSPTISYRELKENRSFINSARNAAIGGTTPVASIYSTDVNSSVTHKPDVGLQLGFSAGYPLSKNLRLIGGLQFNISKYDIRAYSHPEELTTIALNNPNGRTNTVYTVTNYRNDAGYKANWLHNLYFSASAPIGLEYKLTGNKKSYFGVSGTVQPSFILSNRAYLLSTDYKSYAEIPSLIRKWNINTGFELFAGYTTGKVKWRVGPQVRYQVMSSFVKTYPVQEHLFDFGVKLGVMLK